MTRVLLFNERTQDMADGLAARMPDVEIGQVQRYGDLAKALETFRPDVVYSVRYTSAEPYPRDALFGPHGPRWIANGGAGTDHFGIWDPEAVTVTNSAGVAGEMMAEYILGGFLHFMLDVPGLQADQAAKTWRMRMVAPLKGKTLMIVGLGGTGRALALRAKAFGMRVLGTRATAQPTENVDEVLAPNALRAHLPQADFVAICTPLTPATRGLIGAPEIAAMPAHAVVADVSRGGVMDHVALQAALESDQLGGAVLDVFPHEPLPAEAAIWDAPRTLISPHCSSVHAGWEADSFALFLDNLEGWRAGRPLFNIVDPSRGY